MSKISTKKERIHYKRLFAFLSATLVLLVACFYLVMTRSGHWLVDDDEFDHVKWVVVLDGQSADMERSDFAASLIADGRADSVVILGRRCLRNRSNAEFYVDDFMQQGNFDSNAVFVAQHNDPSTIGEAYTLIPWLKARKADTVLLLTYAPATHRVKRIFSNLSGESPVYLTTDIHHYQYNAESWYSSRESRKNWFREWAALALSYVDLWPAGTLTAADSAYFKPIVSVAEFERSKNPVVDLQSLLPKVQKKMEEVSPDSASINSADTTATATAAADTSSRQAATVAASGSAAKMEPAKANSSKK